MAYPTTPTNGEKIGANLCPRPAFNDLTAGGWVGGGTISYSSAALANRMIIAAGATAKITLPGVPVTPATFKIQGRASNSASDITVGVRPVGSARVVAMNWPKTGSANFYYMSTEVTDSILAGDTGTEVELYVKNLGTSSISLQHIRVDYSDGLAENGQSLSWDYFDGANSDTATVDYSWDGTAFFSPSSAKAIAAGDTTPPSAPPGLTVTSTTPSEIRLDWNASTDNVGVAGYNVYEGVTKLNPSPITARRDYTHTGLAASSSHTYTVTAVDAAGNESAHTAPVTGTTLPPPDIIAPPTPTNFRQIGASWYTATLAWDAVTDPSGVEYKVYGASALPTTDTQMVAHGFGPQTPDSDTFQVVAIDGAGNESPKSPVLTATTVERPPSMTYGVLGVTTSTADIYWSDPAVDVGTAESAYPREELAGFWVWMFSDYEPTHKVNGTMLPPETRSYTITGLAPDRFYVFWVSEEYTDGDTRNTEGGWQHGTFTTHPVIDIPPTKPPWLRAISVGETQVILEWGLSFNPDKPDIRVGVYTIYDYGEPADMSYSTVPQKTITNLVPGSTHVYTVYGGLNYLGQLMSEPSEPLTVTLLGGTPPPPDIPPTTPGGLVVTGTADTTVSLAWDAATDDNGVTGYYVYQDGLRVNASAPVPETSYTVTGLLPGKQYSFKVRSVDTVGQLSVLSAAVTASTTGAPLPPDEPPSAPGGLIVTGVTDTTVGLSWDSSTDDTGVIGYRVYRGGTALTGTITDTFYTATGLALGTEYVFTVKAVDTLAQLSPSSVAVTATTTGAAEPPPSVAAPTGLHVTGVTNTTVGLAWDAVPDDVIGYHVYRGGLKLTDTPITGTTYTATGLALGTEYTFTVKAVGMEGQLSPSSGAVTPTTNGTPPTPTDPPPEVPTSAKLAVMDFLGTDDPRILETL